MCSASISPSLSATLSNIWTLLHSSWGSISNIEASIIHSTHFLSYHMWMMIDHLLARRSISLCILIIEQSNFFLFHYSIIPFNLSLALFFLLCNLSIISGLSYFVDNLIDCLIGWLICTELAPSTFAWQFNFIINIHVNASNWSWPNYLIIIYGVW